MLFRISSEEKFSKKKTHILNRPKSYVQDVLSQGLFQNNLSLKGGFKPTKRFNSTIRKLHQITMFRLRIRTSKS